MATEKIKEILGENLVALVEYYTGDEKNILAVCNSLDSDTLRRLKQLKEIPLVLTKEELTGGVDVFPIEFLNIKQHHKILSGEDFLKDVVISKKHLRHQLEFEFRSKLIHLREEYLQFKDKDLEDLIISALPTLAPIIGGLIYLRDLHYEDTQDMFRTVSDGYGIDMQVLKEIYDIKHSRTKFKKDKELYIKDLIRVLHDIGKIIDEFEVIE
ncbi:hypothetical protein ANME2D_02406 [Candidatus Methanoperedens nitroreducens]|uniref:Uncharacterized protein n=1 Tax=Candidatus Methanoperedens nitratireducens TaxID=1392998 RepID=A0A062V8G6_9EURY|nr:hypothetical protein [Candidatus Methanoperedens nitroreducens]KCZ71670.1 hypothetical protein ANME2D_02406 [Candidatus Methanoperedens nitroreducens]MDJ1421298.1 hypothetical protein [Candidatus Methanoperedens sp.]